MLLGITVMIMTEKQNLRRKQSQNQYIFIVFEAPMSACGIVHIKSHDIFTYHMTFGYLPTLFLYISLSDKAKWDNKDKITSLAIYSSFVFTITYKMWSLVCI